MRRWVASSWASALRPSWVASVAIIGLLGRAIGRRDEGLRTKRDDVEEALNGVSDEIARRSGERIHRDDQRAELDNHEVREIPVQHHVSRHGRGSEGASP